MRNSRYTEEQIIAILNEAERGKAIEVIRRHGIAQKTHCNWKSKYGGLDVREARRLRTLEEENRRLRQLVADQALDVWAHARGVALDFIHPGRPAENAYIESFNGRFRDECLNEHWFRGLDEARDEIERWMQDYNEVRPHSSLGDRTPNEYATASTAENATHARAQSGGQARTSAST